MTAREERRSQGRRTRTTPSPRADGRAALLGLMVIALTAAVLTLAGTTPRGIGAPVQTFHRAELEQRQFSCPGGIPGAVASHGSVAGGLAAPTPITGAALTFEDDRSVALESFAGQESRAKDWLAWLPCPEPRARWWFVGAGAATVTHDTVLTLSNPRANQAVLDIDVLGTNGPVRSPGLHGITVPAGGSRVVDLAKVSPAVGELAVNVVATRGLVAISAVDRFAPGVVGKAVQEWLPGQSLPGTTVTLAGLPSDPDRASLVVVNPRNVEAIVSLEVIGTTGTFAPDDLPPMTIPPHSVVTESIRSVFDGDPLAVRVTSAQPVTAAVRTVTGGDVAFATGVQPIRDTTAVAVPSGRGQLVLSSVGRKTSVEVRAFSAAGKQLLDRTVPVPQASSVGVPLPTGARYLRLVAPSTDAVAGFSVSDAGGVTSAGVVPAIRSVLLPVVRPGW
jgi:hypothetical protein